MHVQQCHCINKNLTLSATNPFLLAGSANSPVT